jgi:hypothetical protein
LRSVFRLRITFPTDEDTFVGLHNEGNDYQGNGDQGNGDQGNGDQGNVDEAASNNQAPQKILCADHALLGRSLATGYFSQA